VNLGVGRPNKYRPFIGPKPCVIAKISIVALNQIMNLNSMIFPSFFLKKILIIGGNSIDVMIVNNYG
jgi:hypothetical protein